MSYIAKLAVRCYKTSNYTMTDLILPLTSFQSKQHLRRSITEDKWAAGVRQAQMGTVGAWYVAWIDTSASGTTWLYAVRKMADGQLERETFSW